MNKNDNIDLRSDEQELKRRQRQEREDFEREKRSQDGGRDGRRDQFRGYPDDRRYDEDRRYEDDRRAGGYRRNDDYRDDNRRGGGRQGNRDRDRDRDRDAYGDRDPYHDNSYRGDDRRRDDGYRGDGGRYREDRDRGDYGGERGGYRNDRDRERGRYGDDGYRRDDRERREAERRREGRSERDYRERDKEREREKERAKEREREVRAIEEEREQREREAVERQRENAERKERRASASKKGSEDPPKPSAPASADGEEKGEEDEQPFDFSELNFEKNMREFLMSPCPRNAGIVQCYIKRNKSGTNKLYPTYSIYLKEGDRFLMTSKRRPNNKTSNYLVSMELNDHNRNSTNYIGKVRANFVGTEFQIYDSGINYKDASTQGGPIREELGCVLYASNVLGSRGPRKMQVCINQVNQDGIVKWQPRQKDKEMLSAFKSKDENGMKNLISLINKPPRWNDQVGAYVLNFNGRVTMASVKNFQLVDQVDHDNIILQFGRVAKDEFTCDFQAPISPFQAFAITLSSFDSKIACD